MTSQRPHRTCHTQTALCLSLQTERSLSNQMQLAPLTAGVACLLIMAVFRGRSMTDSFPSARDIAMPRHVVGRTYEFAIDEQYFPQPWDKHSINRPCQCQDCPICGQG